MPRRHISWCIGMHCQEGDLKCVEFDHPKQDNGKLLCFVNKKSPKGYLYLTGNIE